MVRDYGRQYGMSDKILSNSIHYRTHSKIVWIIMDDLVLHIEYAIGLTRSLEFTKVNYKSSIKRDVDLF